MTVFVVFRPEDSLVLSVFSTKESATEFMRSCGGGGRDLKISIHTVDEDAEPKVREPK